MTNRRRLSEAASPTKRPVGMSPQRVRTFRVTDETWGKAKRRAAADGMSVSRVLLLFLEGYAQGVLDTPQVRTVFVAPSGEVTLQERAEPSSIEAPEEQPAAAS